MLDIRLIREQPEELVARLKSRGGDAWQNIERILEGDVERRQLETRRQTLQAERNRLSKEIGILKKAGEDTGPIQEKVKEIGALLGEVGKAADSALAAQQALLLSTPNVPDISCPVGADESANPTLRTWGEKPDIHSPKGHLQLGADLSLFDFSLGAKVAGSGFVVYCGQGARLERALISFLLDLHTSQHHYTEISPPLLVNRAAMTGTGQLPKFEEDLYGVDGGELFLIPTAEVPVTNLERERILDGNVLPIRYCAYTPCFRREAGAAGRESRGLIRMHQFDKVELVQIVPAEQGLEALETLTSHAEAALQALGLHYRVIELCTGDLGFSAAKTYDIEVWAPGQEAYLEVSSCSNFGDFQARRMDLRHKDAEGNNCFPHTLNGSGTALARLYVALLESGQQPDGSILLPTALHPYFGTSSIR